MIKRFIRWYLRPIDLTRDERITGAIGWMLLIVGILAYDIFAIRTRKIETLSRYFWRSAERTVFGNTLRCIWVWLTFHLLFETKVRKTLHRR